MTGRDTSNELGDSQVGGWTSVVAMVGLRVAGKAG